MFNLPNLLTLLRLILTPWIILAIADGQHVLTLTLFSIAAVTDVLDGAVARHWKITTKIGAYLDPIADKCLMSGVFLALGIAHTVPWWFVILVLGRDVYILVSVGIFCALTPLRSFPPSVWGKISTFVQIITAVIWMAWRIFQLPDFAIFGEAMLWISACFTLWSGIHYTGVGVSMALKRPQAVA